MKPFTSGPWHAPFTRESYGSGTCLAIVSSAPKHVATYALVGDGVKPEHTKGNAHLIAAAPELLDAVKQWEIILAADCTDGKTLTALRGLIAKAEGHAK